MLRGRTEYIRKEILVARWSSGRVGEAGRPLAKSQSIWPDTQRPNLGRVSGGGDGMTPNTPEPADCRGATIAIYGGGYFDYLNPDPASIRLDDIATVLGRVCRFAGHCRSFYSVAQHSVLVSEIVPPEHAVAGLLHDAAEAYTGDIPKPLKWLLGDTFEQIERRVEAAVFARFGLPADLPPEVKVADLRLLRTEQRDLTWAGGDLWTQLEGVEPLPDRIRPLSFSDARDLFIGRAWDLGMRE